MIGFVIGLVVGVALTVVACLLGWAWLAWLATRGDERW